MRFKSDERKSPKFLDDVVDCHKFIHGEGITNAIGDPDSLCIRAGAIRGDVVDPK